MLEATKNEKNNSAYSPTIQLLEDPEMKNIRKRADGRYEARIQINNKRISVYGSTQKICYKNLQKLKQGKLTKQPQTSYTLYNYIDYWYKTFKEPFVKLDTQSSILYTIKRIKQKFPDKQLNYFTLETVQPIINSYEKSRGKELMITYLKAMFETALELQFIDRNPFKLVKREAKINTIRNALTYTEQATLLAKTKGTIIETHILFFLLTGIRKGEYDTINLNTDIDYQNKTLKIQSEKKRGDNVVYRYIDLSDKLLNYISMHKSQLQSLKAQAIYKNLKKVLADTNINASLHHLRHTYTTNYACLGAPIKLVSEWLGHEKVELTQNIYNHIDRTLTKDKIIKLYNNLYLKF